MPARGLQQVAAGDHPLEPVLSVQDVELVPGAHARLAQEYPEGLLQGVLDAEPDERRPGDFLDHVAGPEHGAAADVFDFVGLGDFGDQVLDVAGLHEVVERALAHRVDPGVDVGVAGEHEDFGVGGDVFDAAQGLDAVHAGHLDVEQDDVEAAGRFDRGDAGRPVAGSRHLEAAAAQELGQVLNVAFLVVDQQNPNGGAHGASKFLGWGNLLRETALVNRVQIKTPAHGGTTMRPGRMQTRRRAFGGEGSGAACPPLGKVEHDRGRQARHQQRVGYLAFADRVKMGVAAVMAAGAGEGPAFPGLSPPALDQLAAEPLLRAALGAGQALPGQVGDQVEDPVPGQGDDEKNDEHHLEARHGEPGVGQPPADARHGQRSVHAAEEAQVIQGEAHGHHP